MMRRDHSFLQAALLAVLLVSPIFGQKGGGQSGSQGNQQGNQGSQSGQTGGGQGLPGLSYAPDEWPGLGLPGVKGPAWSFREGRTVVCYKLAKANSSSQPFVLQRLTPREVRGTGFYRPCGVDGLGESDTEGQRACKATQDQHWNACSPLDEKHPLLMGQELVIGIEVSDLGLSGINVDQLKALNINVTNQASSPLNPSPVRPTFPGSSSGGGGGGGSTGSFGGFQDEVGKGDWWIPAGTVEPGAKVEKWTHDTRYEKDQIVSNSSGLHLYRAFRTIEKTGEIPTDPFPRRPRAERVKDGTVIWQEVNWSKAVPPGKKILALKPEPKPETPVWKEKQAYRKGEVVCVERWGTQDQPQAAMAPKEEPQQAQQAPKRSCGDPIEVEKPKGGKSGVYYYPEVYYYQVVSAGLSGKHPDDPLSVQLVPRVIYLGWPFQLPGDVIPTFSVNLVYSPPMPGAPWQGNTFYPAGSVVTSSSNNGRYYTALTGGVSEPEPKEPVFPADVPPTVQDGDLVWVDSGTSAANLSAASGTSSGQGSGGGGSGGGGGGGGSSQGSGNSSAGKAQQWLATTHYMLGDVILDPYNGHYYAMVRSTGGMSGKAPTGQVDPFPPIATQMTVADGDLLWLELPPSTVPPGGLVQWKPKTHFNPNQVFRDSTTGKYYQMIGSTVTVGVSGDDANLFAGSPGPTVTDEGLVWMDTQQTSGGIATYKTQTKYSLGETVVSNHRVYVVVGAGISGTGAPGAPQAAARNAAGQATTVTDGDLVWMDTEGKAANSQGDWAATHPYILDAVVHSKANDHYYQVIRFTAGISGPAPRSPFPSKDTGPAKVADGAVVWTRVEPGQKESDVWQQATQPDKAPEPCRLDSSPPGWTEGQPYHRCDMVSPPEDPSRRWQAMDTGHSGKIPAQPSFPVLQASAVIEPASNDIKDGEDDANGKAVTWADSGVIRPVGLPPGEHRIWTKGSKYHLGDVIFVQGMGNGRYYTALNEGHSGATSPFVTLTPPFPVTWQNSGTAAPASVASGQPADQTVNLINLGLPQTHSLSYFNVAAGVIGDLKRSPTFGFLPATNLTAVPPTTPAPLTASPTNVMVDPSTGCSIDKVTGTAKPTYTYYCPSKLGLGPRAVDPVLALTVYFPPVDAERPWRWTLRDFIPGLSFGASLSSPTGNFYVGGSNELFLRNVQLFYGLAWQKMAKGLANLSDQPAYGGVGAAPSVVTVQGFQRGFFIGMTYNLSSFIQSLGLGSSKSQGQ